MMDLLRPVTNLRGVWSLAWVQEDWSVLDVLTPWMTNQHTEEILAAAPPESIPRTRAAQLAQSMEACMPGPPSGAQSRRRM